MFVIGNTSKRPKTSKKQGLFVNFSAECHMTSPALFIFEKNHRDWFTLFAWLYWIMLDWSHFWLFLDSCWRTLTETKKKKRSSTRRTRRGRQIRQKTGSTVGGTEDELTRPEIERRTSLRLKIIGLNREKTRWSEYWNKLLYWAVTIMDILFDIPF